MKNKELSALRKFFFGAYLTKDEDTTEEKMNKVEEFNDLVDQLIDEPEVKTEDEEMSMEDLVKALVERVSALESKMLDKEETTDEDVEEEVEQNEEVLVEDEEDLIEKEEMEDKCTTDSLSVIFAKAKIILPSIKFKNSTTDSVSKDVLVKYKKQTLKKAGLTVDSLKDSEIDVLFEKTYVAKKEKNNSSLHIKTKTQDSTEDVDTRFKSFWHKN